MKLCGFSMQDISVLWQWKNCSSFSGSRKSSGSIVGRSQVLLSKMLPLLVNHLINPLHGLSWAPLEDLSRVKVKMIANDCVRDKKIKIKGCRFTDRRKSFLIKSAIEDLPSNVFSLPPFSDVWKVKLNFFCRRLQFWSSVTGGTIHRSVCDWTLRMSAALVRALMFRGVTEIANERAVNAANLHSRQTFLCNCKNVEAFLGIFLLKFKRHKSCCC